MEPVHAAVAEFARPLPAATEPGERLVVPGWTAAQWEFLLGHAEPLRLGAGDVLIAPREAERALYLVASGRLEVAATNAHDGSLSPLVAVEPGSVVGELAFFDGGPRSARAWAVAPTTLFRLSLADFERYARSNPMDAQSLLFAMARLLAYRVRRLTARV